MASRLACGLFNAASVTTTASVVFSTAVAAAPPLRRAVSMSGVNAGGNPRPPNSPPTSKGAAQNHGPSPTVTVPTALTTASAATRMPLGVTADAEPIPPLKFAVVAPRPAPTLPRAKLVAPAAAALAPALQEIKNDRPGHDRNDRAPPRKPPSVLGEPGLHPAACLKPECR